MYSVIGSAEFASRAGQLAERAMGPLAESWRPDQPTRGHPNPLVGVLLGIADGPDRGYGPTRIAELRAVDGVVWNVWLLGHVLREEFLERASAPVPGELVAIRYEGRRPRRNPRPGEPSEYEAYRVVVDRPSPAEAGVPCPAAV